MPEGMDTIGDQETQKAKGLLIPIAGPLCLLLVGFVSLSLYQARELAVLVGFALFVLPATTGSLLSLVHWPNSRLPLTILKWTLLLGLPLVPAMAVWHFSRPTGESLLIGLGAVVIVALVWLPQVMFALLYFHAPPKGGFRFARRFSLRTFMVGVSLLSLGLAAWGVYVKSYWGPRYSISSFFFPLDNWPPAATIPHDEKTQLSRRAGELVSQVISNYIEIRGFKTQEIPQELRQFCDGMINAQKQPVDRQYTYHVLTMPDDQQVFVVVERHDETLLCVRYGPVLACWENDDVRAMMSAPTRAQVKEAEHLFSRLASALEEHRFSPAPLTGVESRIKQINIDRLPAKAR